MTKNIRMIDEIKFAKAINNLNSHMRNKIHFKANPLEISHGLTISSDWSTKGFRQSYFSNCSFKNAILEETGFIGSLFIDTKFSECILNSTNMQSCDFRSCEFQYDRKNRITATKFSRSLFTNTVFKNIEFYSADFCDCIFDNVKFENCKFVSVSFENTFFKNVTISRLKFRSQNFDYAIFGDVKLIDSALPFPAIPYIINGFKFLKETEDKILISSYCNETNEMSRINSDDYLSLMGDFEIYYEHTMSFFPLVNIYIAQNKLDCAFSALQRGIDQSIHLRNFRMIMCYSLILKYSTNIEYSFKKNLYNEIYSKVSKCNLSIVDKNNLNIYLGKIKNILVNESVNPCLNILLNTNILEESYCSVSALLEILDNIISFIDEKNTIKYSVDIRHNSPYIFEINAISSDVLILLILLRIFYAIIFKSLTLLNKYFITKTNYYKMTAEKEKFNKDEEREFIEEQQARFVKEKIIVESANHSIINPKIVIDQIFINGEELRK